MKINLTIVGDYMSGIKIKDSRIRSPYIFPFDHVKLPDDSEYDSEALYIIRPGASANAEEGIMQYPSVIFIGEPSESEKKGCEWIAVDEDTDLISLINGLNSVFTFFNRWEEKMWEMLTEETTLHDFGIPFAQLVGNPTGFYTNYLKTIYNITDPDKPLPWHYRYAVGTYPSDEEMEILYNDEEFNETFSTVEPSIFSDTIYGYRMLYLNLFENGSCIGRFTVDEIYGKLRPSDASILLIYSSFFLKAYRKESKEGIELSVKVNRLISTYMSGESTAADEKAILASLNWEKSQKYVCVCVRPSAEGYLTLSDIAMYLYHLLDDNYAYTMDDKVLFIMNLGRQDNRREVFKTLENHCRKNNLFAGVSSAFTDLGNLSNSYVQADAALSYAGRNGEELMVHFEDIVTDCFSAANLTGHDYRFYITEKVSRIIDYDRKHHADLLKTLRTALQNNMSATISLEKLHIHRTTYLYRMRRIQEISGLELSDYRKRLYLQILFELLPEEYF